MRGLWQVALLLVLCGIATIRQSSGFELATNLVIQDGSGLSGGLPREAVNVDERRPPRAAEKNSDPRDRVNFIRRELTVTPYPEDAAIEFVLKRFIRNRVTGNTQADFKIFRLDLAPVPLLVVRKFAREAAYGTPNVTRENSSSVEFAIAYTGVLEYTERNSVPGFQSWNSTADTVVNITSLVGSRRSWQRPEVTDLVDTQTRNVVKIVRICRQDNLLCLRIAASNGTFTDQSRGVVVFPDEVRVDAILNVQALEPAALNNRLSIISRVLFKREKATVEESLSTNEQVVEKVERDGDEAEIPRPDFLAIPKEGDAARGFCNFDRTVTAVIYNRTADAEFFRRARVRAQVVPSNSILNDRASRDETKNGSALLNYFDSTRQVLINILFPIVPGLQRFVWTHSLGIDQDQSVAEALEDREDGRREHLRIREDQDKEPRPVGEKPEEWTKSRNQKLERNDVKADLTVRRNKVSDHEDQDDKVNRTVERENVNGAARFKVDRSVREVSRDGKKEERQLDPIAFDFRTSPYIRLITSKLPPQASVTAQLLLSATKAAAVGAFSAVIEYNETNGVRGYQHGQDQLLFVSPLSSSESQWSEWNVTQASRPGRRGNSTVRVYEARRCTDGVSRSFDICIVVRIGAAAYEMDNKTFAANGAKVDFEIIGYVPQFPGSYLAVTTKVFFGVGGAPVNVTQKFQQVDEYLDNLNSSNAKNMTETPTFVDNDMSFQQGTDRERIIVNWQRTVTFVTLNGVTRDARVVAAVLDSFSNDKFDASADEAFSNFSTSKTVVYSFLAPLSDQVDRIFWDPEFVVDVEGSSLAAVNEDPTPTPAPTTKKPSNAASSASKASAVLIAVLAMIISIALL